MKLRRSELDHIAQRIVEQLLAGDFIKTENEGEFLAIITKTITEDLMVEDRLNEEVRQILSKHVNEVQRHGVEYHQMFNIIKAKLVKERNLIL
jgi:hypothetical protein